MALATKRAGGQTSYVVGTVRNGSMFAEAHSSGRCACSCHGRGHPASSVKLENSSIRDTVDKIKRSRGHGRKWH